jgi:hypothetical protein
MDANYLNTDHNNVNKELKIFICMGTNLFNFLDGKLNAY